MMLPHLSEHLSTHPHAEWPGEHVGTGTSDSGVWPVPYTLEGSNKLDQWLMFGPRECWGSDPPDLPRCAGFAAGELLVW